MDTKTQQTANLSEQMGNQNPDLAVREKQATSQNLTHQGHYFEPLVDIYETPEALVVEADVPGASAEDIDTDIKDHVLTLTARVRPLEGKLTPLYREYSLGHYTRTFRLGQEIDQMKISAHLKDGVLTLTLPKADSAKPRKVKVQVG